MDFQSIALPTELPDPNSLSRRADGTGFWFRLSIAATLKNAGAAKIDRRLPAMANAPVAPDAVLNSYRATDGLADADTSGNTWLKLFRGLLWLIRFVDPAGAVN